MYFRWFPSFSIIHFCIALLAPSFFHIYFELNLLIMLKKSGEKFANISCLKLFAIKEYSFQVVRKLGKSDLQDHTMWNRNKSRQQFDRLSGQHERALPPEGLPKVRKRFSAGRRLYCPQPMISFSGHIPQQFYIYFRQRLFEETEWHLLTWDWLS